MTAFWALTAQAIMVSIAWPTACLAAAALAAFAITGLGPTVATWDLHAVANLTAAAASLWVMAMTTSFWPSLVAAALTEGIKVRGLLAYLVVGCAIGFVRELPIGAFMVGGSVLSVDTEAAQLSVAAGAVGGLVYWLIAGRSAGRWLELRWFEPQR